MKNKPKWIEGVPEDAGCPGFFFVVNEDGDKEVVEVGMDGKRQKTRYGTPVAWSGPLEQPDDETLP